MKRLGQRRYRCARSRAEVAQDLGGDQPNAGIRIVLQGVKDGACRGRINAHLHQGANTSHPHGWGGVFAGGFEKHVGYSIASFFAFVRTLSELRTFTVSFEVEGVKKTYRSSLVFIGVGERELKLPTLGARVKNGRRGLHVMIVRGRKRARLFAVGLAGIAKGAREAEKLPEFDEFIVDSCRIDLVRRHATIGLDGELKRMQTPLDYRLQRDAIRLVAAPPEGDQ